jgi:two-component system, chemotaxis family, response regulator Rcp1
MPPRSLAPIEILLVEDNSNDAEQMVEALQECELQPRVTVVEDGEAAIAYLQRPGEPLPDLILLDLHLPRKSGHEVLAVIKQDERLRRIPVVIMTASDDDRAFRRAYELYANCCVQKPSDLDQFPETVKLIEGFWRRDVTRPRPS